MWKKEDGPAERSTPRPEPTPTPEKGSRPRAGRETATIGRSISIRGDVTGDEDLLIQGRVDGSVDLKEHSVTVGPDGVVQASIVARVVTIEGRVEGDLSAEEQVILRGSAWVQGDISSPRVVLEDGAQFRGGVDMGEMARKEAKSRESSGSSTSSSSPSDQGKAAEAKRSTDSTDKSENNAKATAGNRVKAAT